MKILITNPRDIVIEHGPARDIVLVLGGHRVDKDRAPEDDICGPLILLHKDYNRLNKRMRKSRNYIIHALKSPRDMPVIMGLTLEDGTEV